MKYVDGILKTTPTQLTWITHPYGILPLLCLPNQTHPIGFYTFWVSLRLSRASPAWPWPHTLTHNLPCEPRACLKPKRDLQIHLQSSLFFQACPLPDASFGSGGVDLPNTRGQPDLTSESCYCISSRSHLPTDTDQKERRHICLIWDWNIHFLGKTHKLQNSRIFV